MQTILSRRLPLAVVATGILAAAILLLMTASARAVVPEEHATSAPNDGPLVNDPRAIPGQELKDPGAISGRAFAPSQVIVKFKEDVGPGARADVRSQVGLKKEKDLAIIKAEVDKVEGRSVEEAVRALERRPEVQYAQPNFKYHPSGYADEPRFGELWGLNNSGQNGGTSDVDINGLEASAVTQGDQNLVVAVIDDGVDFTHPDLKDRAWKNLGESGSGKETNGVDDDANGYIDDVNGWDFYYGDKTVHDPGQDYHGTHVSGTIAASVNGQGVVGVAPNVEIMALKFLGPEGGWTDDAIEAIQYAKAEGAKISNNSWGGGPYDQALYDAINNSGSLFVAAAGNDYGNNNDAYPSYPASYDLPNILSVAAVDNQGNLASFSNYGPTSVDISAPGVGILSSVPGIPDDAAALSSIGSSGKALTAGFGVDEIGGIDESAKRTSFFNKAFQAVDRGSQQVVLVDDDASNSRFGWPDVGPTVSAAIEGATGSAPQVIDIPYGSNGPALSQLSGKTVVWATGQAYFSADDGYYVTETTLTSTDQATLTQFLNGGGKLIITGMDALYWIEGSPFVTSTLNLNVASDFGGETFSGASGTAFAGESYSLTSATAYWPYHDIVAPATSAAVSQGRYPGFGAPPTWESWDGTSMATPHATGAAALVASVEPALLESPKGYPEGLKNRIMDTGKPLSATAGKTVSGDMVDALNALKAVRPPADTTPPQVTDVAPTDGEQNVSVGTSVEATFSEAMDASTSDGDASTIDGTTFTLTKPDSPDAATDPDPVAGVVSYNPADKKATLDPSADLDYSTTYTATVTTGAEDLAGNQFDQDPNTSGNQPRTWSFTTAAPQPDTSSPTSTAASSPPANSAGWNNSDVTVTLSATDNAGGSGVEKITYSASGAQSIAQTDTFSSSVDVKLEQEGTTTLSYYATDKAGNDEAPNTLTVKIDKTTPTITNLGPTTQPNAAGWYNTDVTNRFKASDALSGLSTTCTTSFPAQGSENIQSKTTSGEGLSVKVTSDSCTDVAGNTAAGIYSDNFQIDKTPPKVDTVSPTNGAKNVALSTNPSARFSEKVAPASIDTPTFTLYQCSSTKDTNCTTQVTGVHSVSLSDDGLTATLDPYGSSSVLAKGTKYKAVVTTGVTDEAGNALDQDPSASGNQEKVWYFTTRNR
jgi:subtilisin family serine protease